MSAQRSNRRLTITVKNNQGVSNTFFFFQSPALFQPPSTVYGSSLFTRGLGPKGEGGSIMLAIDVQPQAGVQDGDAGLPRPGHISGYSMAVQSIDLAVPGSNPPALDSTVMLYDANTGSLGLSAPRSAQNVTAGCFQIETAIFTSPPDYFNIGSAVYVNDGVVLSSFVAARPRLVFEIQPVLKFYVANGNKEIGSVIKVDDYIAFSASCDFTAGYSSADVAYQPDGSWNVVMA